ncbi:uncharacterized protein AB675_3698 [Cyphellophora attinorum]|uniref:Uncharacterized protein n=1 Tax=Cyphellophora attinorum TaxID=1664694 RepID=A0A0N0NJL1_9EURO|nr:uncharacterized protein AB675_3698 [Phialophora attinorum]KPI37091.1 hypothetical protein AB675_3698 [Phialophora attinorum]
MRPLKQRHAKATLLYFYYVVPSMAGVMSPITIINFSPAPIDLDFTFPSKCVYYDFNPDSLRGYYSAYRSPDLVRDHGSGYVSLNKYLQGFKTYFGIPDLEQGLQGAVGRYRLPPFSGAVPPPFSVHQIQMDGSGSCFGKDSWKQFSIDTPRSFNVYELRDPSQSNWEITKFLHDRYITVDIGKGGYAGVGWVVGYAILGAALVILVAAIAWPVVAVGSGATGIGGLSLSVLSEMSLTFDAGVPFISSLSSIGKRQDDSGSDDTINVQVGAIGISGDSSQLNNNFTVTVPNNNVLRADGVPSEYSSRPILDFYDLYSRIPIENRQACLFSAPGLQDQNCYVAGTAIIIQADGTPVAYPLPDVSHAY